MSDFKFPKARRLLKKADFDLVFERRRSRSDHLLVVYARANALAYCRLGMVVSRRYGNSVVRGRWKRCLREAFRLAQHELPPGLDLVVLPRGPGQTITAKSAEASLRKLAARLAAELNPPLPSG